jgi:hypothetical protein
MSTPSHHALRRLSRALMLTAAVACSACEEAAPTAPGAPRGPSPVIIEGSWAGTLTDVSAGTIELQMTATGYETTTTGTFTLRPGGPASLRGRIAGNVRGPSDIVLFMTVEPPTPECSEPGTVYIAELALDGNRLTGTFDPITPCPALRRGSIDLVRR